MPSPFPGMDPYLENAETWGGFHHSFADEIKRQLNRKLGSRYYADVEVRVVVEEVEISTTSAMFPDTAVLQKDRDTQAGQPPVAVKSPAIPAAPVRRRVEIPDRRKLRSVRIYHTEQSRLVTSVEILSPFNKREGEGLEEYRRKRARILRAPVHLIEIDLLREGIRPGREVREPHLDEEYTVLVNRADGGNVRTSEIWPIALADPLPVIPVPLLYPDPDVPLDLQETFHIVYDDSKYDRRVDYRRPVPPPPLRAEMAAWWQELVQRG